MSEARTFCTGTRLSAGFYFPDYKFVMAEFHLPDFELYTYFAAIKPAEQKHLFFLESLTGDENARYSILGFLALLQLETRAGLVSVSHHARTHYLELNMLEAQRSFLSAQSHPQALPCRHFCGGLVGYWGYDLALQVEGIKSKQRRPHSLADASFFLPGIVVVHDRLTSNIRVFGYYEQDGAEPAVRQQVNATLDAILTSAASPPLFRVERPRPAGPASEFVSNTTQAEFEAMVAAAKQHIFRGDIFQAVLSQRWKKRTLASPFEVYTELRRLNPSPYMFYLHFNDNTLIGSSPEMLVKIDGNKIQTRPIAGTRPVTHDEVRDALLRRELADDPKEQAEHIMLVDLGRNDVGKVSLPGTVEVNEFMQVAAFSHVVHLVSRIQGQLKPGADSLSALQACYPAGTLSGAPKRRAMEIIDSLEKDCRGPYGGAVGYLGLNGCLDSCITIRSLLFRQGCCYFQAGAGIVADSVPSSEYQETVNKARALMIAVQNVEERQ
ncbi:MAG: anthranilate synthase component I family protein [Syntrophomonadaceae bacterium]|nr:anthranilate synthase component I family protein [Syntrophomonadaceae bacterium]